MGAPDPKGSVDLRVKPPGKTCNYFRLSLRKQMMYNSPGGSSNQRFCVLPNYFGSIATLAGNKLIMMMSDSKYRESRKMSLRSRLARNMNMLL